MERCNYVALLDNACSHNLEEKKKGEYKLNEIEGLITFCESGRDGLIIRLSNQFRAEETAGKELIWNHEEDIPAICGQGLRGFYEETHIKGSFEKVYLGAYELFPKENSSNVIRRGLLLGNGYKWVMNE